MQNENEPELNFRFGTFFDPVFRQLQDSVDCITTLPRGRLPIQNS